MKIEEYIEVERRAVEIAKDLAKPRGWWRRFQSHVVPDSDVAALLVWFACGLAAGPLVAVLFAVTLVPLLPIAAVVALLFAVVAASRQLGVMCCAAALVISVWLVLQAVAS